MPSNHLLIPEDRKKRAEGFAGREWVLREIADWMDNRHERFLLLTGEPGSGKTALCAWLAGMGPLPTGSDTAVLERIRGAWSAAHFCMAETQRGTLDASFFSQSLSSQLAQSHSRFATALLEHNAPGIVVNQIVNTVQDHGSVIGVERVVVGDPEQEYQRLVRAPLNALFKAESKLHLFLLIDALDEAATVGTPNIVTLLSGSDDLPKGVRFLITCRDVPAVINAFPSAHVLALSSVEHKEKTDRDIRTYIEKQFAQEPLYDILQASESPDVVLNGLVDQADGNFLYIRFVLEAIAKRDRTLTEISGLPRGLFGLYRTYLDRLMPKKAQVGVSPLWADQLQPLLGCLSIAIPAAPRKLLPEWLRSIRAQVPSLLTNVKQVTEYDDPPTDSYRLYHRSVAEFLAADSYHERDEKTGKETLQVNEYHTPPDVQHGRIIEYYLTNFMEDWTTCDLYGLRQLVRHMQSRLRHETSPAERRSQAQALYNVALDEGFRSAQRKKLGGIHAELQDLQAALETALDLNDFVRALQIIGVYRQTVLSENFANVIFRALDNGEFDYAVECLDYYSAVQNARGEWVRAVQLYIAWEANEAGQNSIGERILRQEERFPVGWMDKQLAAGRMEELCDMLIARARGGASLDVIAPLSPDDQATHMEQLDETLTSLEGAMERGDAEAISLIPFLETRLPELLLLLAPYPVGPESIDRALWSVIPNPYPAYRNIGLIACARACLCLSDMDSARSRLRDIFRSALDQEGVTFTFDLPSLLLSETIRRNQPAPELAAYVSQALTTDDSWGTAMRAYSARAASLYRQGLSDEAFATLVEASTRRTGFAGYGTLTLLSLIGRCVEFAMPETATKPTWGSSRDISLEQGARWAADQVVDYEVRSERQQLVEAFFNSWLTQAPPRVDEMRTMLSNMPDLDMRRAYVDLVSAQWVASTGKPEEAALKALIPSLLMDGTTLDLVLGRLFGPHVVTLKDGDLAAAVDVCTKQLTTGKPWDFRKWAHTDPAHMGEYGSSHAS